MKNVFTALLLAVLPAVVLPAQDSRATITGTVIDSQGAAVPDAKVEAKNLQTNLVYPTVTTTAGVYTIPLVPAGEYSITASHEGFERYTQPNVAVRTGERVQADFRLSIGAMTQEVTVSSVAPLLEAATASRGQVVALQVVESTPIMGRNIAMLATLAPGVQIPVGRADIQNVYDGTVDAFVINGGRSGRNNFTINGLPDVSRESSTANSTAAAIPPPEATAEVSVHTSEYSAEYGHTGGGTINVTTRSGTNQPHGNLYEYWRNDALNANLFQQNANGIPTAIYKWNQPGAELDGPVFIPRIYNGKNRTFFMFSWEEHRNALPLPVTSSVPTALERAGDFSVTTANGRPVIIYDPLNTAGGVRQPFPGNRIPQDRINPIGSALAKIIPKATTSGTIDHANNFVLSPYTDHQQYDVFSTQVDHNVSARNRVGITFIRSNRHEFRNTSAYSPVQSSPDYVHWRINHNLGVSWTSTLTPTTVLSIRAGYTRRQFAIDPYAKNYDLTHMGFPASLNAQVPSSFFPNISETNYLGVGRPSGSYSYSNDYVLQAALEKVVGRHSLKAGWSIENLRDNYSSPGAINFAFTPVFTQQNALTANTNQGNAIASMLLGYPTSGGVPYNLSPAYGNHYYALYIQDDWRITSNLTINAGLRWDMETPRTERYDHQNVGFDPSIKAPLQVPGYNLSGGLLFASRSNRYPFVFDKNNFQPRIGAAYRIGDRMVFRGGFAVFYLPAIGDSGQNNGFSIPTQYNASNDGNVTPAGSLSNPFPTGILAPPGASQGGATFLGQAFSFGDPNRVIPYVDQFSFGFQRLLPWNLRFDASYSGSRTKALEVSNNINALSLTNLALGATALNRAVPNPFAGLLPGTTQNGATTTQQQLLLPFPQFQGITKMYMSLGHTWYNSVQVNLEKRFSSGLFVLASATISKNMEAVSYLDPQSTSLDRELTADDSPFRMRISWGYTVPGLRNSNRILRTVLGGWQISNLVTVQKGTPVAAPTGAFSTGVNSAVAEPTAALYFNHCYLNLSGVRQNCNGDEPAAWIQQPQFTLNTLSRRLPNIRTIVPPNVDLTLSKIFPIRERLRFKLSAGAFNLTNTAVFGAPTTTLTSPLFGTQTLSQANDARMIELGARIQF